MTPSGHWKPGRNEGRQLQKAGYDGLFNSFAECACKTDDLYPCRERQDTCLPGILMECDESLSICPCSWHIGPKK